MIFAATEAYTAQYEKQDFRVIFYHPIKMENKNYLGTPPLNTINIAYSFNSQGFANFTQRKRQEHLLQFSNPRQMIASPKNQQTLQSPEAEFSDTNLKYGKSQTLKQSVFNRMRIHIYRKDKRPKWLELPSSSQADDNSITPSEQTRQESKSIVRNRQNKTSLIPRKLMNLSYNNTKIRTDSSDDGLNDTVTKKTTEQFRFRDFEMINQIKINRIVKEYLESERNDDKSSTREERKMEELKMRRKYRILSDSSSTFAKKYQGLKNPPKLHGQAGNNQKSCNGLERIIEKQDFEAWENSSELFSSHKNGIIQYTKEFANPEVAPLQNNEKSQNNIFSSKKRRMFLIKQKK